MAAALKCEQTLSPVQLIEAAITGPSTHICQTTGWKFQEEMQSADALTRNAEIFFASPATVMLFPSQIGTKNEKDVLLFERPFYSSAEKQRILEEMRNTIQTITKSSTLIDETIAVADEFVTNALYNAPYVNPITHVNQRVDRLTTTVTLPKEKPGRLFLAEDGARLVIGIQDLFGSLDIRSYLQRISHCYSKGVDNSINFDEGGAGIGSYIIFNTGSSLYYGVKPGQMTLLACVIPYRLSRRERGDMPKHLHWIQVK